jgi:hypothetical protein
MIKSRSMRGTELVARTGEKGNACRLLDDSSLYYRVLHPVARNIKLQIIISSFPQQLTKYFIMCPLYSRMFRPLY